MNVAPPPLASVNRAVADAFDALAVEYREARGAAIEAIVAGLHDAGAVAVEQTEPDTICAEVNGIGFAITVSAA
jgi:hypothetical protein